MKARAKSLREQAWETCARVATVFPRFRHFDAVQTLRQGLRIAALRQLDAQAHFVR